MSPRLHAATCCSPGIARGLMCTLPATAADFPRFEAQEIDPHAGEVCYAVTAADVNGDGKPDVVVATEDAVVWYENPTGRKHDIIRGSDCPRQRLHPAARHRWRRPHRLRPGSQAGSRPTPRRQHASVAGPRPRRPLASSPDRVRGADAAPAAVWQCERRGAKATRGCGIAGPGNQGTELGARAGGAHTRS